uniref:Wsv303-like protein n=1 Tax=Trachysalambria curvirostris majanivirus TaxID=2984281 RepID=A0A9C7EYY4_9VIRU|nr:MAG: wsv303-like protein [Trachysalambria curvirostris majanivirus]
MKDFLSRLANNHYSMDNLCIGIDIDFGKNKGISFSDSKLSRPHLIDKTTIVKSLNETSQKQFTALRLREEFPPCSILIFSMGSVIIVGLKKLGLTHLSVLQAVSAIADTQEYPITISNVEVVNVVSTFNLFKLDFLSLQEFFRNNMIAFTYVPDSFPGLFFKVLVPIRHLKEGETIGGYYTQVAKERENGDENAIKKNFRGKTVLVFQVGKCTILGVCGGDDIQVIFKMLFGFFWYFIDKSIYISKKHFIFYKNKYHIPPLSWYLMTDFFLRTAPNYKLNNKKVLSDLVNNNNNNSINNNDKENRKKIVEKVNYILSRKDRMLRCDTNFNYKDWILKHLIRKSNKHIKYKYIKPHQCQFERNLNKICAISLNDDKLNKEKPNFNILNRYFNLQDKRFITYKKINKYVPSNRVNRLFKGYKDYLPSQNNTNDNIRAILIPIDITENIDNKVWHRGYILSNKDKKLQEKRKKYKRIINKLDQFEEIYEFVEKTINKGKYKDIAEFLKLDPHVLSSLLFNELSITKDNLSNDIKYTNITPAQSFFNRELTKCDYSNDNVDDNRRGILDFILNDNYNNNQIPRSKYVTPHINIIEGGVNNGSMNIYLDIHAIEKFLDEQTYHGMLLSPLSNYRTQHHQSLQTRLTLENLKRKSIADLDYKLHQGPKNITNNFFFTCCKCKMVPHQLPQLKKSTNKRTKGNYYNNQTAKRKKK